MNKLAALSGFRSGKLGSFTQSSKEGTEPMSRKDFELIAATIRRMPSETAPSAAEHFADALRSTNPRFDRARFIRACGVN
ncbi:MAG TPA: hypothetical protein VGW40_02840 [Allosphingosinicella sp.]|nr:hypothetical protein [Allosphingosinicella sp.]